MPLFSSPRDSSRVAVGLLAVIAAVAVLWLLRSSFLVSMPLAFGFILALIVSPVHRAVSRRLPEKLKWLGFMAAMLSVVGVLVVFGALVYLVGTLIVANASQFGDRLSELWSRVSQWSAHHGLPVGQQFSPSALSDRVLSLVGRVLPVLWEMLGLMVLVFFFALFMLLEAHQWGRKTQAALPVSHRVAEVTRRLGHRIRLYAGYTFMLSLMSGVAHGSYLWLLDVNFWYLWALLFFLLNFIPNIGSFVAFFPPLLVTLIDQGFWRMVLVLAIMLVVEETIANFIAPRIHGKEQKLSPLVVIFAIMFWGWVWGLVGAFLAVPMTITVVVICAHVKPLKPVAMLLGRNIHESIGQGDADS